MNKTELRVRPHKELIGQNVFEVWYDGKHLGNIVGADGPGIRFVSTYDVLITEEFQVSGAKFVDIRVSPDVALAKTFRPM